jgi:hypothetical protein
VVAEVKTEVDDSQSGSRIGRANYTAKSDRAQMSVVKH